jgi:Mg2+/Co2+ transporter CorC
MNQTEAETNESRETLTSHEVNAISGVFSMEKKTASDIMISIDKVDMISSDTILNLDTMRTIDKMGHSRLPVYKNDNKNIILGYLLVKKLILINTDKNDKINEASLTKAVVIGANQKLADVLNTFQSGHAHLAIVSNNANELQMAINNGKAPADYCKPLGIITFEDVIENVLNMNIMDEYDKLRENISTINTNGLSVNLTKALIRTPAFAKTLTSEINSAMLTRCKSELGSGGGSSGDPDVAKDGFKRGTLMSRLGFLSPKSDQSNVGYLGLASEPFQVTGKQSLLQPSTKYSNDDDYVAQL